MRRSSVDDTIRPDVLFVGPMRSGTSWLHQYLTARGDVCLPLKVKETFFFDRHFNRGAGWYARHFRHYHPDHHLHIAEVAPSLFPDAQATAHVASFVGERIAIVFTLRDPIERAWSHYCHYRKMGFIGPGLAEALKRHPEIIAASRYRLCLERWHRLIPHAHFVTLHLDMLCASPEHYVRSVCQALDLPERSPGDLAGQRINAASAPTTRWIAGSGAWLSLRLRAAGFYTLVNVAKRAGLKRVFFGAADADTPQPCPSELAVLEDQLSEEAEHYGRTRAGVARSNLTSDNAPRGRQG